MVWAWLYGLFWYISVLLVGEKSIVYLQAFGLTLSGRALYSAWERRSPRLQHWTPIVSRWFSVALTLGVICAIGFVLTYMLVAQFAALFGIPLGKGGIVAVVGFVVGLYFTFQWEVRRDLGKLCPVSELHN